MPTLDEVTESLETIIDGLYAYDMGCVDSGIHDENLKKSVQTYMAALPKEDRRRLLSHIMRDLCLSDEVVEMGYGWQDARLLGDWFNEQFGVE